VTNLNALIDSLGPIARRPDEARAAVLHVLRRVDGGQLTATEGREALEALGLIPETRPQIPHAGSGDPATRRNPR
jgi:hypothetical protein